MAQHCTFSPHINPSRVDYEVGVVERNELWMQQKTKKLVEVEQEETLRKLKQCTFAPNVKSKKNDYYLREKEKRDRREREERDRLATGRRRRDANKMGYEDAKRSIQNRINTLQI